MIETGYFITYNGLYPWGSGVNGDSTPYVSVDVEEVWSAGKLGTIRTVTLNGTLPSGGLGRIPQITNTFLNNFKPFSAPNIYMPYAVVQDVTFGTQNYIGKVDYSITLKDFSGFLLGVNNPVDEISFQTEQDGSVTASHKISALGIPTTAYNAEQAFLNAKSFVQSRTGSAPILAYDPIFAATTNRTNLFLLAQQETINRALGVYGINETWKYDPLRGTADSVFKRFSADVASGIAQDYVQVSVVGNYQTSKDIYSRALLESVTSSELFGIASKLCEGLNPLPLSFNVDTEEITEGEYVRSLSARASYDNSPSASWIDYETEASKNFKDGISQVNIKGQIVGNGRHVRRKFQSAMSFFTDTVGGWGGIRDYLFGLATQGATEVSYTNYPWNPIPKSISAIFNSGLGTINIQATFDDAPFASGYSDFSWGVGADCGLNVFKPAASANKNGSYLIQDLNILNRTSVNLNGNFVFPATGGFSYTNHNSILSALFALEGSTNAFVENQENNISSGEAIRTGFVYNYTKDGAALTALPIDGRIYAGTRI